MWGFLNIDKPQGITSHDVVAMVRREIKIKRVGHAGTLDPLATGVLVLCVGKASRLSEYIMAHTKIYQAELYLGIETDTYDADGQILHTDPTTISCEQFESIVPHFRGKITQIPPMYSAIKQGGKKLYELARQGQIVERSSRLITIDSLEITSWNFPRIGLRVVCSAGTYIRSLAHDIGQMLGVGGHLSALRRLASGKHFTVENAVTLVTLQTAIQQGNWQDYLLAPDMALTDFPRIELSADQSQLVRQGGYLDLEISFDGIIRVYTPEGHFLALMEPSTNLWKPLKVFI